MKNKTPGSGESIFRKKGFFIALYSCLGAVMVLALVISFTNLMGPSGGNETARNEPADDTVKVAADQVESYLAQAESDEQAWLKPKPTEAPKPTTAPARPVTPAITPVPPRTIVPVIPAQPTAAPEAAHDPVPPQPETPAPAAPAPNTTSEEDSITGNRAVTFTPFSEDDKMIWPVQGDIAMAFSADKLIYDPTLDQYRTNDDIRIAAQEGTPVKAGAEGRVLSVGHDNVYGNYVEIDHGNGWVASYGQLMDGILVGEGDIVKSGQVIGGVGKPSYFGSLNGTHMNLRLTKDSIPVDPRSVIAEG